MPFPKMVRIRQKFEVQRVADVAAETSGQLRRLNLGRKVRPGQTVAITVGSRGIANIAEITKAICDHVRSLGAKPVIIPAMGSHGGGTAEAQASRLTMLVAAIPVGAGVRRIAARAQEKETGARGLRSIIEDVMLDIMFDLPDRGPGQKYVITPEVVTGRQRVFPTISEPKHKSA